MFVYAAGDNWGIVRAGSDDGLIGTFDNGVTTTSFSPTGNLGGGDLQGIMPASAVPLFVAAFDAGCGVLQHQAGVSVAADRRLRLRPAVCADHLERLGQ